MIDLAVVDLSRLQFALTALYHFLFVPLTLGLSILIAIVVGTLIALALGTERSDAEIVAFRTPEGPGEHVALLIGAPNGQPPLVRLHSECLTGDVLGSLKCDCGPQLHAALAAMGQAGEGVLLYLNQEGRGIGLANKMRAYSLQNQGFDTVDANTRLGFAVDARDFGVAARMLTLLGQDRVRLLTNNPAKVAGLERAGVQVVERVRHLLPSNPHNERYLATKRDRTGHQLRLLTRDEHTGTNSQSASPEPAVTDDVLHRLATAAPLDHLLKGLGLFLGGVTGEDEALRERIRRLEDVEQLRAAAGGAHGRLAGADAEAADDALRIRLANAAAPRFDVLSR